MLFTSINGQLDQLERTMPVIWPIDALNQRHDWRPILALMEEIQAAFKTEHFSSRQERESAWSRFNTLRDEAHKLRKEEGATFARKSGERREWVIDQVRRAEFDRVVDAITFSPQTKETMKGLARELKEARDLLHRYWPEMTRDDRQLARDRIDQCQADHNGWWDKAKVVGAERREEAQDRTRSQLAKAEENIERNHEQLAKATTARERTEARISEVNEKLSETNSEKWRGIYGVWLEEAEAKHADIEQSIDRIRGWIEEGEERVRTLRQRL